MDEVATVRGDLEKSKGENMCQTEEEEEEEDTCQTHVGLISDICQTQTEEEEDGAEADGGYSSNSCNGGEDHHEGSQDDYDPFNEDGLEQTNGLEGHTETEYESNLFHEPGMDTSQRNGPTEDLESQDADDETIDCNQDNDQAVLRTGNAFLGDAEKDLINPLEDESSPNLIQSKTCIGDIVTSEGNEKETTFVDESEMATLKSRLAHAC